MPKLIWLELQSSKKVGHKEGSHPGSRLLLYARKKKLLQFDNKRESIGKVSPTVFLSGLRFRWFVKSIKTLYLLSSLLLS